MIRRVFKWGALAVLALLIALSTYGYYLYRQVRDTAERDEAGAADAIIVMGAAQFKGRPLPVFKARLDHAFDLYQKGFAKAIITTGGYGPGLTYSEAQVGKEYLIRLGVDESGIVTEQVSGTTRDSVRAATDLMGSKGWVRALVVSDGFHLYRVKRMFEDHGVIALTSPAPASPIEVEPRQRFRYSIREVLRLCAYQWFDL